MDKEYRQSSENDNYDSDQSIPLSDLMRNDRSPT